MRSTAAAIAMSILSIIFGPARGESPPQAVLGKEDGFVDIGLTITDAETLKDGTISVVARGIFNGTLIGLAVDVLPEWKAQKMDGTDAYLFWGKIRYRSTGEESNAFLAALCRLYGAAEQITVMAPHINVTAVGLNNDPRAVKTAPIKMKAFFFEDGPEDRYAEVYTNIDFQKKKLEFHEKDPEYRVPLLRALHDPAQQ